MDLFSEDINTRAAAYADRHAPTDVGRWIWDKIADAYVEGARSQANLMARKEETA